MVNMTARISPDDTRVALYFPEPPPGYSLEFTAEELERFIEILVEVRTNLKPPISRA